MTDPACATALRQAGLPFLLALAVFLGAGPAAARSAPPDCFQQPGQHCVETLRSLVEASVREIGDEGRRLRVQGQVAMALAEFGDMAAALDAAAAIPDEDQRAKALRFIAFQQLDRRDIEGAATTVRRIANPILRDDVLRSIAGSRARFGNVGAALATAETIGADYTRDYALADIAHARAKTGDLQGAFTIIGGIQRPALRAAVISDLAVLRVRAGEVEAALAAVRRIEDEEARVAALGRMAQLVLAGGDRNRTLAILAAASAIAQGIDDPERFDSALLTVVMGKAGAGFPVSAFADAILISDLEQSARAFIHIAGAHAKAGEAQAALAAFDEIRARADLAKDQRQGDLIRVRLAIAEAAQGHVERAFNTAAEVADHAVRDNGLYEVTATLANASDLENGGDLGNAKSAAARIGSDATRAEALLLVARSAAKDGESGHARALLNEAVATARQHADEKRRAGVLLRVVEAQVATELMADALATARAIESGRHRALALEAVAGQLSAAGDHDEARRLLAEAQSAVSQLADAEDRFDALRGVASMQARAGYADMAVATAETLPDDDHQAFALGAVAMAQLRGKDFVGARATVLRIRDEAARREMQIRVALGLMEHILGGGAPEQ
ncbi:hypothetical protein [Pelagibius sp.]|uniref:hypothetical protein n=1 Tax=Pelagibius sp. TaxID=1931238 RepID=UPI00260CBBF9|nr:hypothetical protein [Pelagibius sp.]